MGDNAKKVTDAIDAFEKCLDAEIEIGKEYKQKADVIKKQYEKICEDTDKELTKFESELEKEYYSDDNKEIADILSTLCIDNTIQNAKQENERLSFDFKNLKYNLELYGHDSLDAFTLSWFGNAFLSNDDVKGYVCEIDGLKQENEELKASFEQQKDVFAEKKKKLELENKDLDSNNDKICSSKERKFLIAAIMSFAIAAVFAVLAGVINNAFLQVGSAICGIGIVAGIVFLILKGRVFLYDKEIVANKNKIKQNKTTIDSDDKELDVTKNGIHGKISSNNERINELKLSILIKAVVEKQEANFKKRDSMMADSQAKFDLLDSKSKEIGDEAEMELAQRREEIFSGLDPIVIGVLNKAFEFPMNYRRDFVLNCRVKNVDSVDAMLTVFDSLKNKLDDENAKSEQAMRERRAAEDARRALDEQNRILQKQAYDVKKAQDEQNRLLQRQADDARRAYEEQRRVAERQAYDARRAQEEQRRMQEKQISEQKRIGEEFRTTMCYQCKNHVGCSLMWHLTGPCPNYVKGK